MDNNGDMKNNNNNNNNNNTSTGDETMKTTTEENIERLEALLIELIQLGAMESSIQTVRTELRLLTHP
jgi:hypothetical protein